MENLSLEKIKNSDIELNAIVEDVEYTGIFSKITYDVNGVKVRNIEKNNGKILPKVKELVSLYLSLDYVMQFGDIIEN